MFLISLFILFFATVFFFDRLIFRDFLQKFDDIGQLFRLHRTSGELRDMNFSSLERRLDELEEKFGKITNSHNSRMQKMKNAPIELKEGWQKFIKFDDIS